MNLEIRSRVCVLGFIKESVNVGVVVYVVLRCIFYGFELM